MQKDIFDAFFKKREQLIWLYNKGDMSKKEFIEENFHYVMNMGVKPFRKIDYVKKGIFNYQYYNSLAKYYHMIAYHYSGESPKRQEYIDRSLHYYKKKDHATLALLDLVDYNGVDAYFIKVRSHTLKDRLIEIRFENYSDIILHTTNQLILSRLKENYVFQEQHKTSAIPDYVNQLY